MKVGSEPDGVGFGPVGFALISREACGWGALARCVFLLFVYNALRLVLFFACIRLLRISRG